MSLPKEVIDYVKMGYSVAEAKELAGYTEPETKAEEVETVKADPPESVKAEPVAEPAPEPKPEPAPAAETKKAEPTKAKEKADGRPPKECVDHLGIHYKSAAEMCAAYGLRLDTYCMRCKRGYSLEKALITPLAEGWKKPTTDHTGQTFASVKAMCDHYGVSIASYYFRKNAGHSLKDILTDKKQGRTLPPATVVEPEEKKPAIATAKVTPEPKVTELPEVKGSVPSGTICYELDEGGHVPSRAHTDDAGFDLHALEDTTVRFGAPAIVKTGAHLLIPSGYVGLICPRSGLTQKGIVAEIGVVDAGFTGEIQVTVRLERCGFDALGQLMPNAEEIKAGSRIAQIVLLPIARAQLVSGDVKNAKTERGQKGYGSTGV